ncbi:hypothetical protein DER46DRAFT_518017 [Fusarium sp. MPI-SDFR-AT-0072]|nr:hypothetical protein DER46DRAFT_518017 [Fusarium sp. MPI-SDFR-AT-0072]
MLSGYKQRSWRQCMAETCEKQYGPLDDPVPTFGAKLELVTAPSTPALPSDLAGPDIQFLEQLDRSLRIIGFDPIPKCLQGLRFVDPEGEDEEGKVIFSETDSDEEEFTPWSSRDYAIKLFKKAGIDIEAIAAERRAKRQKRKREAEEDEQDSIQDAQPCKRPRRKIAQSSETTTARPKRQIRPSQKQQASYSPPQTPSPTEQEHTQGQAGSTSSCESLVAQQPTPEVDNSPSHLKLGKSQESPNATSARMLAG